jgi:DNA-binding response OmpR family regulator
MQTILVIDDDESVRSNIGLMLEREKFIPVLTGDGISGFEKARTLRPQLILVDLRLPGMSGLEICKQLRAEGIQTPLIVLSATHDEIDKVLLLEVGADDYVEKPFGIRELLARIRALLRRTSQKSRTFHFGEAEIDVDHRTTTYRGAQVKLTPAEYKLLLFFLQNPDRIVTRDQILNSVWGYEAYPNTRTVDAHVVRLRHKLEPEPNVPRHFMTVHGVGYRFLH